MGVVDRDVVDRVAVRHRREGDRRREAEAVGQDRPVLEDELAAEGAQARVQVGDPRAREERGQVTQGRLRRPADQRDVHVGAEARADRHVEAVVDALEEIGDAVLGVRPVRVGDHDHVGLREREARLQRGAVALVVAVLVHPQLRVARLQLVQLGARAVRRAVVDDQDRLRDAQLEPAEAVDDPLDAVLLVVGGDDDGDPVRARLRRFGIDDVGLVVGDGRLRWARSLRPAEGRVMDRRAGPCGSCRSAPPARAPRA